MNMQNNFSADYLSATGDTPVGYEWIGRQTLRGIPMTGLRSVVPHELVVGDRIRVTQTSGTWNRSGVYDVQLTHDADDHTYNGELIIIDQRMEQGEISTGTWERVPKTTPLTPYSCPEGKVRNRATGLCEVTAPVIMDKGGLNLPSWAIWVAIAGLAGGLLWFNLKRKK